MWKKITLVTTTNEKAKISFNGRGSIYADGTFGGGTIKLRPVYKAPDGTESVPTGFIDDAIDGSAVKSIDCPSGHYEIELAGSTGASVDVYYNDQEITPSR